MILKSLIISAGFFQCLCLYAAPEDTIPNKKIVYVYDTIRTEKIIYVYDTVRVIDTLKKTIPAIPITDPVMIPELPGDLQSVKKSFPNHYLTMYAGGLIYKDHNPAYPGQIEKPLSGYTVGLMYSGSYNEKISLSIGLESTSIGNNVNYPFKAFIDSSVSYQVNYHDNWTNDTIDRYFQLIGPDTNWNYVVKPVNHPLSDSTSYLNYDTIVRRNAYQHTNKLLYLNIPILIGWEYKLNHHWGGSLQSGIIASFLYQTNGKILKTSESDELTSLNSPPLISFVLIFQMNLLVYYRLNNGLKFFIQSGYRYPINSLYNTDFRRTSYSIGTIHAGISIPF